MWRLSFLNGALLDKQLNHLKWKKKQNLWGEAKSMNLGGTKALQEHGRRWESLRQILRSRRWFCLNRILGSAASPHCLRSTHFPKPWFRYDPHPRSLCFILPTQEVVPTEVLTWEALQAENPSSHTWRNAKSVILKAKQASGCVFGPGSPLWFLTSILHPSTNASLLEK